MRFRVPIDEADWTWAVAAEGRIRDVARGYVRGGILANATEIRRDGFVQERGFHKWLHEIGKEHEWLTEVITDPRYTPVGWDFTISGRTYDVKGRAERGFTTKDITFINRDQFRDAEIAVGTWLVTHREMEIVGWATRAEVESHETYVPPNCNENRVAYMVPFSDYHPFTWGRLPTMDEAFGIPPDLPPRRR